MSEYTMADHHLSELRQVVAAAAVESTEVAIPWPVMAALRTLLHSDVIKFEGVDYARGRSYFCQVYTEDCQEFTSRMDPIAKEPFWKFQLLMYIPDGYGRQLRLLCFRFTGRDYDQRECFDLQILLPHLEAAYRRGEQRRATLTLTARQVMLLDLVRDGYTNVQIAKRLGLAEGTVRTHLNNIYARLGVQSRTEAVNRVFADGRRVAPPRQAGALDCGGRELPRHPP